MPAKVIMNLSHLDSTPVTAVMVKEWTRKDPVLSQVVRLLEEGWPEGVTSEALAPYYNRRNELSLQDGCVLWGARVVIPPPGRENLLEELHETHPGCSRMKSLARCFVYWPGIDKDIEGIVSNCVPCQENRNQPASVIHPWQWPEKPWSRVHADFAGPFMGSMFLIIIDAHSKWIDVYPMNKITTEATIEELRTCFTNNGIPDYLVTDNGPSFKSEAFEKFMEVNGIIHLTSAPYHPESNGLAERAVQVFKSCMKKIQGGSLRARVNKFLLRYRVTPQTTTGRAPCVMLNKRSLKCKLDLVRPNLQPKIMMKQGQQKTNHDKSAEERSFVEGDTVFYKNFTGHGPKHRQGVIEESLGTKGYIIRDVGEDKVVRRHMDHIAKSGQAVTPQKTASPGRIVPSVEPGGYCAQSPGLPVISLPVSENVESSPDQQLRSGRPNKGIPAKRLIETI